MSCWCGEAERINVQLTRAKEIIEKQRKALDAVLALYGTIREQAARQRHPITAKSTCQSHSGMVAQVRAALAL
jgi:anti-sigma factor ChrR (cupin superfamily)